MWIETYKIPRFYPLAPRIADIDIEDIAHSLSQSCRYAGHCSKPYSVAEHCCYVSDCLKQLEISTILPLFGLLHDAAEAYIGDMVKPVKDTLPSFNEIEDRLLAVIFRKFCGRLMDDKEYHWVKIFDNRVLINEAKAIIKSGGKDWGIEGREMFGVKLTGIHDLVIECWSAPKAESEYLKRFKTLCPKGEA